MSEKTDTLTDFDKQLIAGMEEVVAHINGESVKGREAVVEFADAKAIREGLGMSQAVFPRAYGIPLKTLQHWEQRRHNPDRTASAYHWTIEEFPDQVREGRSVTRRSSPQRSNSGRGYKASVTERRVPGTIALMEPTATRATEPHEPPASQVGSTMEELLDDEFVAFCAREAGEDVTLDEVLEATASIPGSMAQAIIEDERADRF